MGDIYTGAYECLEVFAKSLEGKKGNVIVADKNGNQESYPTGRSHYRLLKIPLEKESRYDVTLESCEVSVCYLSEREDFIQEGVCFLEWEDRKSVV